MSDLTFGQVVFAGLVSFLLYIALRLLTRYVTFDCFFRILPGGLSCRKPFGPLPIIGHLYIFCSARQELPVRMGVRRCGSLSSKDFPSHYTRHLQ